MALALECQIKALCKIKASDATGIYSNLDHRRGEFFDQALCCCLAFTSVTVYHTFSFISFLLQRKPNEGTRIPTTVPGQFSMNVNFATTPPGATRRRKSSFGVRDKGVRIKTMRGRLHHLETT